MVKGTKILLVDDDQNLLTSLSDILAYKGFETLSAGKGKEAVELIKQQPVDVVLIDLRLADMSGLDLLQEIKRCSPNTECILLTGYASQSSAIEAIRYGAFGYFQKPFDIDQVVLSIQQAGEKYQVTETLAANERRLRALIENGRDNIVLLSAEGKLIWGSPSIAAFWGYSMEDNLENEKNNPLHPEERDWLISFFQDIINIPASKRNATFRLRRKNAEWRWVEATAVNSLSDPAIQAIVINFRDITEQKVIEDRLRLLGYALKAAANAIVITNREGSIQWVNPAFEALTGYSFKEVSGQNPRLLKSGEQKTGFYKEMWKTILSGDAWHGELTNKKKDGTTYTEEMTITPLLDTNGRVENFIAIKQDISDRKQFEKTLALSESRYRSLFEDSPVSIWEEDFSAVKRRLDDIRAAGVTDFRTYLSQHPEVISECIESVKILDVNKDTLKMFGAVSKEQLLTGLSVYIPGAINDHMLEELVLIANGVTHFEMEILNKTLDGRTINIIMNWNALPGFQGDLSKVIVSKIDISGRKQYEENLALSEARFRSLFEESPVAILEEDFSLVKARIESLRKRGVKDWRRYFKIHPELAREMASSVKILDVNKAAIKYHGARTKQDLIKKDLSIFFPESIASHFIEELACFAEGKDQFHLETVNSAFDGRLVNIIVYWSVAPGHEQDLSKVIVSIIDISDLKNAEEELKRKNQLQEKIVTLGRELAASLDLNVIYRTAERHLKTMIDCPNFGIILFDPKRMILTPAYISSDGELIDPLILPPLEYDPKHQTDGRSKAIASRNPVIVKDLAAKRKAGSGILVGSEQEPQSAIYIPMLAENQVIGLVDLQSYQEDAYSDDVAEWLSVTANQIGLAIQNARLHEDILHELTERKKAEKEIRRNLTELELLYENALTVNQMFDPDEIGRAMIEMFTRHFSWRHAVIRLRERDSDDLRLVAFNVPGLKKAERSRVEKRYKKLVTKVGDGLSGWVVKTGQPLRIADVNSDPRYAVTSPGIKSGLYVPIKIGMYVMGSITIESEVPDAFSERDERLLLTIANQAAIAFENAFLYQEVQRELAERRSAELALRESQGRLQSILDHTSALVYIKDLEGRYILVNNAMTRLFGIPLKDMIGKKAQDLIDYAEASQHTRNDEIVLARRAPVTFEEFHTWNNQSYAFLSVKFPLWNERGEIIALCGISTDITEQKEAEEQLRLLSYAVEQSSASVILTDKSGNIVYVNKRFKQLTGYQLEEIVGKNPQRLDSGYVSPEEYKVITETINSGREWRGEFHNRKKTGEHFWESASISPVLDKNQQITHFLEIKEDITARKEAELALRRLNLELEDRVKQRTEELHAANISLEKASRLKDEFLASMSHELRTPLTGVLGLSEALQKGVYGALNEKQVNILHTVEEGGRHLLNLINDILDLSKIEAGKMDLQPSIASVDEVCQASLRMVKQIAASKNQRISFVQNPLEMMIYADPRRIKQILVNLLGNAVKFTPENGELGLEVTGDEEGDVVMFSVWDKGIGIAQENMDKLFKPFSQIDSSLSRSYAGTGLGLSLAQRLAQMHEGHIDVISTRGQGSRFTVIIPWHKAKTVTVTEPGVGHPNSAGIPAVGEKKGLDPGTVLLVEDNQVNSTMLSDFLMFQGYKVIAAQDGKKGLELVSKKHPDMILMDIQMPGIDGFEAIRTIRALPGDLANVPIIALTALAMPEDRQRCLDAGANDYMSKPVDLNELLTSIKKLMEEK